MTDHPLHALQDAFADLTDLRIDRTREHHLLDIVAIAVCAVICGADSWVAVEEFGNTKQAWLRTWLHCMAPFRRMIPSPRGYPAGCRPCGRRARARL